MSSTAAPGKVGNLPQELTSFVGRRCEVTEAKRVLATSRLVSLTGTGGVGKTRLALRVAGQARTFDDGVWLVELGQLQDSTLLAHTVADALGLREQLAGAPTAMLTQYLADRRLLLMLDNCEHLVDEVAKLADALLRSCPGLRVLATSRERLGVSGEVVLPVSPLPVPDPSLVRSLRELSDFDAVTLFVARATAAVPEFHLTEDDQVTVAKICHRLEGLPLAIELAAARLPALSPQEILHRLSDRFRLLRAGPRSAPARQQTLRTCIEWSYELCTSAERLLWARLAVFAGGFELAPAEGICAGADLAAEDLLDLVSSLVDKSILIRERYDTVVRYRLLETIREFGRDKLRQTGEETAVRRRHRDWYAEFVTRAEAEWISSRQADWFASLEREHPNLRAALEFCLTEPGEAGAALPITTSLYLYWLARGLLSEGRQWLDRTLAQQPHITAERARALYAASMLAGQQHDLPAVSALVEEGHRAAEQLGDAATGALFTLASGYLAGFRGDLHRSVALLDGVLDIFRAEDDLPRLLEALFALEVASEGLGDPTRTLTYHQELLAITEPRGEAWYRSLSLWAYGLAVWSQGQTRQAAELVRKSLRLKRPIDDLLGAAWCLEALAWIAVDEQDPRRAATLLGAADDLWHAIGASPATIRHLLDHHEECERRTRHALSERAFHAAFRHGSGLCFADAVAYALDEKTQAPPPTPAKTTLTQRERQVAELIAEGITNKEIATRLVIGQRTAETHVENILVKLGMTSRTQIATWVVQQLTAGQDDKPSS